MARSKKYEKKLQETLSKDGLIKLQGWARDGDTMDVLAGKVGVARRTLLEWRKEYPKIDKAIKEGKEVVDYAVENALLKNALSGDVKAEIFWLKNRKPDVWRAVTYQEQRLAEARIKQANAEATMAQTQADQLTMDRNERNGKLESLSIEELRKIASMPSDTEIETEGNARNEAKSD